jgi:alpha-N-acetylglucosamine transferase
MYAFVIIHFGNKPKYLELEIYVAKMLRDNSKYDIVYMYSINDTPSYFVDVMTKYCTKTIPFDDKGITYDIKNFKSLYQHFNTLRTCDFLFAYQLTEYKKVCIIESDMIILKNIDDIFDLKVPSVLTYYDKSKILDNYKINIINISNDLEKCSQYSNINGGVMLIKPSIAKYKSCLNNIKKIINNNCIYPNETLFLLCNKTIYNLPFKYNGVKYNLQQFTDKFKIDMKDYLSILHMNAKEHKHINIIRDKWLNKLKYQNKNKQLLYYFISLFKKKYYNVLNKNIQKNILNIA